MFENKVIPDMLIFIKFNKFLQSKTKIIYGKPYMLIMADFSDSGKLIYYEYLNAQKVEYKHFKDDLQISKKIFFQFLEAKGL